MIRVSWNGLDDLRIMSKSIGTIYFFGEMRVIFLEKQLIWRKKN